MDKLCVDIEKYLVNQDISFSELDIDLEECKRLYVKWIAPFLHISVASEGFAYINIEKIVDALEHLMSSYYSYITIRRIHQHTTISRDLRVQGATFVQLHLLSKTLSFEDDRDYLGSLFIRLCMYRYYLELKQTQTNIFNHFIPGLLEHYKKHVDCNHYMELPDPYMDLKSRIQKVIIRNLGTKLIIDAFIDHIQQIRKEYLVRVSIQPSNQTSNNQHMTLILQPDQQRLKTFKSCIKFPLNKKSITFSATLPP